MAPAEVEVYRHGEEPEKKKLPIGAPNRFEVDDVSIGVNPENHFNTNITVSGDFRHLVSQYRKNSRVLSEGETKGGHLQIVLFREGQEVEIKPLSGDNRIVVRHIEDNNIMEQVEARLDKTIAQTEQEIERIQTDDRPSGLIY